MAEQTNRRDFRRFTWLIGVGIVAVSVFGGCSVLTESPTSEAGAVAVADLGTSRVASVQVDRVESPAFGGREFGSAGPYELVYGRVSGEVDPADPRNATIVNLDRAPRNAQGMVEYSADFRILKPIDMTRGNQTLFYDILNRGNLRALNLHTGWNGEHDPSVEANLGDAWLLEQGYTIAWSAWQGDVQPGGGRMIADIPIATNPDGGPMRRWIMTEILVNQPTHSRGVEYPAVAESMPEARLYRRERPHAAPELLPRALWSFGVCDGSGAPVPGKRDVCLPDGFSPNFIYHLVYEAQDPIVMGIGFAAMRDFVSFLRHDTTDDNPVVESGSGRNAIQWVIQFGQSQSGRFVRDFLHYGFNQDTGGGLVFDAAVVNTAGSRRTFTNYVFSTPGRFVRGAEDHYFPGADFPFSYATLTDPLTGRIDGLLASCVATQSCPKIMQWDTANEVWTARGSLVVTDPLGMVDVEIPENVRMYMFAGTQHQAGDGTEPAPDSRGRNQLLPNPNPDRDSKRALIVALQAWMTDGTLPPPSEYPSLSDGTLVAPAELDFPSIPGVRFSGKFNDAFVNDYIALPTRHTDAEYTVLVPNVDEDGNDTSGIRSTMLQVPLGTYSGWNLRAAGFMEGELSGTSGGYIPFAKTAGERGADPRLSLEERYGTHERYVELVRAAAERLQQARLLRPQDAERLIHEAEERNLGLPRAGSQ